MKHELPDMALLLVEDSQPMAHVYQEYLRPEPYDVTHVDTGRGALDVLRHSPPRVVLLDLKLPDMDGLDILYEIGAMELDCTVIVITANGSVKTAVDAMRRGAADFLVKPFNADRLIVTLNNALEKQELSDTVKTICDERTTFCGFIGSSLPMQAVYRIIEEAAPSKASVFITGESGTGKEVCADAIHQKSQRKNKPFIALNCAAIPKDLMESEIFGHIKGAFTGAMKDRTGAAQEADGGVLFLDEICDLDLNLQAKLLRFIQTGTIQKLGGNTPQQVDVRIICATNKSPWAEVEAGRFREDLYFRLHVIPMELPALRVRGDDIMELAEHFLKKYAAEEGKPFEGFEAPAEDVLRNHAWPGNVRELQNIIRNMVVLNTDNFITNHMMPAQLQTTAATAAPIADASIAPPMIHPAPLVIKPMKEVEWDYIQEALALCGNNVPKAAALLDISPSTIYRRIREFSPRHAAQ
ncbi:MAG: sigma-54-dependent Fis family transcriptional regulator [Magnetovibrio sp.]|nr:sigma-54-dependent Fis family transcriptional regulator [Magnetovibrio sp.]